MCEWERVKLNEVCREITVGHVGPMADKYIDDGTPFLRSLSVEPFRINREGLKFIDADFHAKLKKSALRPGDVVIVRTGKPGSCAVIPDWLEDANCSDLVIARCGPRLRPRFLCYVVNSVAGQHIDNHLVGAVQQHFNVGSARTLEFDLPDLEEQDEILALLGALDDKIELNGRMNETLEAMARAIFKDWFVDFGPTRAKVEGRAPYLSTDIWDLFPDALDDEGKPAGWNTYALSDLVQHHRATVSPGAEPNCVFEHYSFPACDAGNEPILNLGASIKSNKTDVPQGAVLLSKLNPETERVWLPNPKREAPQVASTEFLVFTPVAPATRSILFYAFKSEEFRAKMVAMVTGTSKSHQRVPPRALLTREILAAEPRLLGAFDQTVLPLTDRLLSNRLEAQTLAETRNLLLPKLMSGKIRLAEAEKVVESVG